MNPQSIPAKTAKGAEEIEHRRHKLDHRLRALLLTINGKTTVGELMKNFERFGDVASMLQQLQSQGFIDAVAAPTTGADIENLKADIVALIHDALGPGGDVIAEKVEECRSLAQLRHFMMSKRETLEAALGKSKGVAFGAKIAQLLD